MASIRRVEYKCSNPKCGATDHDKLFPNESIAPAITCWKCGSGRGLELGEMLGAHKGMWPTGNVEHPDTV